ncbi:nitroreductase family deazaflavin-dependent oxidoreductase [Nocardia asteroides]|uniref:nitroreductase family deazaflavin-dependent oxidoreductase n=1 Tax=Nocardia asteroides TaxID=1824 RepID=UPI001E3021B5|nr:nitroreductase family deazaflavin-dependent oxidoreductase [Nocardia asteroides]UGT59030.1 nitroreductase family deazaflavin-dependent oxidoreductase [Nocardia asteroides]
MSISLWFQRKMNARTATRIRRKGGSMMGMEVLILHTVGRRSGEPRETPLSWFADGSDRLVIASGGGDRNPDWYANLRAHPEQVAVELHGSSATPVVATRLDGAERDRAWARIVEAQPRYAKYQKKSDRDYPLIRLSVR